MSQNLDIIYKILTLCLLWKHGLIEHGCLFGHRQGCVDQLLACVQLCLVEKSYLLVDCEAHVYLEAMDEEVLVRALLM
jgi:hypothetical protein